MTIFLKQVGQVNSLFKGIIVGFLLAGCAAATFSYHYYGMKVASYDGKLLGLNPVDDKDFSTCKDNNCVVMLTDDFFALKQDYLDLQTKLISCQKGIVK
jgi:hypothetical protein